MFPARVRAARRPKVGSPGSVPAPPPRPPPPRRPPPAGPHPFETAGGQQARRSVRVFIANAALRNVGEGCDSGMWMEPETRERFSLIVDEVKEYVWFQETAKVGRRHQACDRPVTLSTGPSGDSRKRTLGH